MSVCMSVCLYVSVCLCLCGDMCMCGEIPLWRSESFYPQSWSYRLCESSNMDGRSYTWLLCKSSVCSSALSLSYRTQLLKLRVTLPTWGGITECGGRENFHNSVKFIKCTAIKHNEAKMFLAVVGQGALCNFTTACAQNTQHSHSTVTLSTPHHQPTLLETAKLSRRLSHIWTAVL